MLMGDGWLLHGFRWYVVWHYLYLRSPLPVLNRMVSIWSEGNEIWFGSSGVGIAHDCCRSFFPCFSGLSNCANWVLSALWILFSQSSATSWFVLLPRSPRSPFWIWFISWLGCLYVIFKYGDELIWANHLRILNDYEDSILVNQLGRFASLGYRHQCWMRWTRIYKVLWELFENSLGFLDSVISRFLRGSFGLRSSLSCILKI